jgi:phage gp36-like protein
MSFCCLTTSPIPLLWVHVLCVVWPQAQHHCCEFVFYVLSDHKPNTTAVSSCSMCCLTTSSTPLLWVHDLCCLTTSPTPLLWFRVLCVVWPQAQHREFVFYVLSDHRSNTTVVSSCSLCCLTTGQHHCCKFLSFCCLTTSPTPLLWVRVLCVVWPQAQHHCCDFVFYVLSDHRSNTTAVSSCPFVVWPQAQHHCCEFVSYVLCDKPNTIDVSLCPMCCPSTSTTPLLVP